jgi:ABC-type uncharacterized transport system substrate-binding protein
MKDIPIVVLASHDGVEVGLYASLAHPGRNVTGVESIAPELDTKRLDLLKKGTKPADLPVEQPTEFELSSVVTGCIPGLRI